MHLRLGNTHLLAGPWSTRFLVHLCDRLHIIPTLISFIRLLIALQNLKMFSRSIARPLASSSRLAAAVRPLGAPLSLSRAYSTPMPTGLDQGEQTIYKKLSETFPGNRLEVQDVSGAF